MIGNKIREIRTKQGMTLSELAKLTNFTASYISQIERDLIQPSLSSLRKIANALNIPIYAFLTFDEEQHVITKADSRTKLDLPHSEITYEFVSPMASDKSAMPKMEIIYFELQPDSSSSEEYLVHAADESIFVLEGSITVLLDEKTYVLEKGDNIYIRENVPHRFFNPNETIAKGLSVISPAIY